MIKNEEEKALQQCKAFLLFNPKSNIVDFEEMKEEDYAKILIDLEKAGPLKRIEYPDFYATLSDDKKRVIFQEKHSTKKSVEIIEIGVLERRGFAIS